MAGQFLLDSLITFLWVLLKDEDVLRIQTVVTGVIVGSFIIFFMRRFVGGEFYFRRVLSLIKLILLFIKETFQSGIVVIKHILEPHINIEPGIFSYRTCLEGEWEVTILSLLLTLTPGSVVMEIDEKGTTMYIHAMDIKRYKGDLEQSLGKFEKAIMEVTR